MRLICGVEQSHQKNRILQLVDASLLLTKYATAASLIYWMKTKNPVHIVRITRNSKFAQWLHFSFFAAPLWSLRQGNFFSKRSSANEQIQLIRVLRKTSQYIRRRIRFSRLKYTDRFARESYGDRFNSMGNSDRGSIFQSTNSNNEYELTNTYNLPSTVVDPQDRNRSNGYVFPITSHAFVPFLGAWPFQPK